MGRGVGLGVLVALVGLLVALPAATVAGPHPVPPTQVSPYTAFPTPIQHVVVVYLENAEASTVLASGLFEEGLYDSYAHAPNAFSICHPSEPNYLAGTSGSPHGRCGTDAYTQISATNIGDLLETKNRSWAGYMESMPSPCDLSNAYPYAVKHNPFVFYRDIVTNSSRCRSHDLPLSSWNASVAKGTIPSYSFITPNLRHDGHDTSVAFADRWLKGWLTPLLSSRWYAHTVFFVTYDEGTSNRGANGTTGGGHIYLATVSPFTSVGASVRTNVTLVNLLTTTEWLLGLGQLGRSDNWSAHPPMTALFDFPPTAGASPPNPLALSSAGGLWAVPGVPRGPELQGRA
ncbi:MAG: alkaline phosphatase family protein [Thermoplasmata archaeon]|nr:alkaline phosphatase family protein [Thermoplasmata archaeon]